MAEPRDRQRIAIILGLGTTQTLAWASSYYLVAFLAEPQARELGIGASQVYAAFTGALLLAALVGPKVGRTIDRLGGRGVLVGSNLLFMLGLVLLAIASSAPVLWLGWLVMGAGMGLGLYDAAFAALGRIYGTDARKAITGITLLAGLASTIGWPVTSWGIEAFGWRQTCLGWAGAHLLIGLPLNLLVLPRLAGGDGPADPTSEPTGRIGMDRNMWLLAFAFAAGWVVAAAIAAHLPRLLQVAGASTGQILIAGMLLGPAQVAARAAEATVLARISPLVTARVSMLLHPAGAALILAAGPLLAVPFMLLHGCGQGVLTVARGTVPLSVFGPKDYGYRLGLLSTPTRVAQAFAPLVFSLVIDRLGTATLMVTSAIGVAAALALMAVRLPSLSDGVEGRS